jgi:hypothetical protein
MKRSILLVCLCLSACVDHNRVPFQISCKHMGSCLHQASQLCEGNPFIEVSEDGFFSPAPKCLGELDPETKLCSGKWEISTLCEK